VPQTYIGALYNEAGFAVLVPERRGYGRSEGETANYPAVGPELVQRFNNETDDVLAALDYAVTLPIVDPLRLGIAGWSRGGSITMLALSRSPRFRAGINEAGAVDDPDMRTALIAAARAAHAPVMLMDAEDDGTTIARIMEFDAEMTAAGRPHEVRIYPPYTPPEPVTGFPPSHMLFAAAGVGIWGGDAVAFFRRHL
jgi:dienelactone hydrolase